MKTIILSLILILSLSARSEGLIMKITNPQINGNQVIFDVSADNFTDMVGMQYSINYDPALMTYVTTQNFNLPDLILHDFNSPTPGVLLNVWVKRSAGGVFLKNGTVIYQIVFEMVNKSFGAVCFSENPLASEFIISSINLTSFSVVDGCHFEPFQINLTTGIEDIANRFVVQIQNVAHYQKITFSVDKGQAIEFHLFDVQGNRIASVSKTNYTGGVHTLDFNNSVIPGVYIMTANCEDQYFATKILFQ